MQTTLISTIISHAAALPTQVLMPSIVCRKLWTLMAVRPFGDEEFRCIL